MFAKRFALIVVLILALTALAACAGQAPTTEAPPPTEEMTEEPAEEATEEMTEEPTEEMTEEPTEEAMVIEGDVVVDGSSTVYPITTAVAEEFAAVYPDVRVSVGLSGTGGGFEKFCNGETDISDASRAIKEEEAAACETNGI